MVVIGVLELGRFKMAPYTKSISEAPRYTQQSDAKLL